MIVGCGGQIELHENVPHVFFDRLIAYDERSGNSGVGAPFRHERKHF